MDASQILIEAAGRIPGAAHQALSGIDSQALYSQPADEATRSPGWCGMPPANSTPNCRPER